MIPGDLLICAFINSNNIDLNLEFKEWPLHITVVPWFRLRSKIDNLNSELQKEIIKINKIDVDIGEEDYFGFNKDKLVNLISNPNKLNSIEKLVRRIVKNHAFWLVDNTSKRHIKYNPHVTAQLAGRVNKTEKYNINKLYLIKHYGKNKKVIKIINLKNE